MDCLEVTTRIGCKVNCVYCPQAKLVREYRKRSDVTLMSLDVFRSCVGKLPLAVDIHFSGMCEPWLNPECGDMILHAHARGHRIKVSTTLTGLSIDDVDRIESIRFKSFNVHLPLRDGNPDEAVDEHRLTLLRKLESSAIDVSYRCHGAPVAPQVEALLGSKVRTSKPHTRAANRKLAGSPLPKRKRGHIECRRRMRQNVLLPNGDVALCCMDYGLQHVLGNLLSGDYAALLRSDELARVRKGLKDESEEILCRYCEAFADRVNPLARTASYLGSAVKRLGGARDFRRSVFVVSFPASGRTWLKVMMDRLRVRLSYTSDDAGHRLQLPYHVLSDDKSAYRGKKVILLTRNPKDVVVSGYFEASRRLPGASSDQRFKGTLAEFVRDPRHGIEKVLTFYAIWRRSAAIPDDFLHITYEQMRSDTVGTLRKIIDFLGIPALADAKLRKTAEWASFEKMRKREEQGSFERRYGGRLLPGDPSDPESFKVRRGRVGGYADYLDEADIRYCEDAIAGMEEGRPFWPKSAGGASGDSERLPARNGRSLDRA